MDNLVWRDWGVGAGVTKTQPGDNQPLNLMLLPPELRCQIYTCLSELAYKSIFPIMDASPIGKHFWPVYRMPTSLLQTSRQAHDDVKGALVQTPLRKLNDQSSPTVVLGPYFTWFTALVPLSNYFYQAAVGRNQHHTSCCPYESDVDFISSKLATWYNQHLSALFGQSGGSQPSPLLCSSTSLHPFVEQTLRRMANSQTVEIHIRLLFRGSGFKGNKLADRHMYYHLLRHMQDVSRDPHRRHYNGQTFTLVRPHHIYGHFPEGAIRKRIRAFVHVHLRVEEPASEDQRFFDKSCYFDHLQNYQENDEPKTYGARQVGARMDSQWQK